MLASAKKTFNTPAAQLSEAELALNDWGIPYKKQKDGTIVVPGDISLFRKDLTELPDLSKVIVKGSFYCDHNKLTNLIGAPASVGANFWCDNNKLTSLTGAPASIGRDFWCNSNPELKHLENAPQKFKIIRSDFGSFKSWDEVPENLKISPATLARQEQERLAQTEEYIRNVAIVKKPIKAGNPLTFKKR